VVATDGHVTRSCRIAVLAARKGCVRGRAKQLVDFVVGCMMDRQ